MDAGLLASVVAAEWMQALVGAPYKSPVLGLSPLPARGPANIQVVSVPPLLSTCWGSHLLRVDTEVLSGASGPAQPDPGASRAFSSPFSCPFWLL